MKARDPSDRYAVVALIAALLAIILVALITHHGGVMRECFGQGVCADSYLKFAEVGLSATATVVSIWAVILVNRTLRANQRASDAAVDAVSLAERNTRLQLAAFVSAASASTISISSNPTRPGFLHAQSTVKFENSGDTPAYDVTTYAQFFAVKTPFDPVEMAHCRNQLLVRHPKNGGKTPPLYIAKSGSYHRDFFNTDLTVAHYEDVKMGTRKVALVGWSRFTDAFAALRTVEFIIYYATDGSNGFAHNNEPRTLPQREHVANCKTS